MDGKIYLGRNEKDYDRNREAVLKRFGIKIIRFTNDEILTDMDKVVEEIKRHLPSSMLTSNEQPNIAGSPLGVRGKKKFITL